MVSDQNKEMARIKSPVLLWMEAFESGFSRSGMRITFPGCVFYAHFMKAKQVLTPSYTQGICKEFGTAAINMLAPRTSFTLDTSIISCLHCSGAGRLGRLFIVVGVAVVDDYLPDTDPTSSTCTILLVRTRIVPCAWAQRYIFSFEETHETTHPPASLDLRRG